MTNAIAVWGSRLGLAMVTIATLALTLTGSDVELRWRMFYQLDKVGHFIALLFFTAFILFALPKVRVRTLTFSAIIFAALIEIVQYFGPRSADLVDFAASSAGVFAVTLIYYSALLRTSLHQNSVKDADE